MPATLPIRRRLDGAPAMMIPPRALRVSAAWGLAPGIGGAIALRVAHAPAFPGSIVERILSSVFVAGALEMILHLGILSIVTRAARGRGWVGVVVSTIVFVLLQSTGGALDHPLPVILAATVANVATGLVVGWLYLAYGFEFAVIGRAISYLIPVIVA